MTDHDLRFADGTRTVPAKAGLAVYPGSFDPITLGHLNVMERASRLFEKLIVGVGVNIEKTPMFTPEERVELIRVSTRHLPNIEIRTFTGLAVEFVKRCGAQIMIRGVRPITDIQAELTMMMANRRLAPEVETLFMVADGELAHVSSSLIKQIASVASERELARFLPPQVVKAVLAKFAGKPFPWEITAETRELFPKAARLGAQPS